MKRTILSAFIVMLAGCGVLPNGGYTSCVEQCHVDFPCGESKNQADLWVCQQQRDRCLARCS